MSGTDVAVQLQLEQRTTQSLRKKLRKARRQRDRAERQQHCAEHDNQALSEQLDADQQMQTINELWQQVQDAKSHVIAQQKQAEQQLQAVQAAMTEQQEAAHSSKLTLEDELELLRQKLEAAANQQTDVQRDLQAAQQQSSILSADNAALQERLQAAQQQIADVTAERDAQGARLAASEQQTQAWTDERNHMLKRAQVQADKLHCATNRNLAFSDAVRRAHAEKAAQAQQAAELTVQLDKARAEVMELQRSSAAEISQLQAQLLDLQKMSAVYNGPMSKHAAQQSLERVGSSVGGSKPQADRHSAVATGRSHAARPAPAAPPSKSKQTTAKVGGLAQHGKVPAAKQESIGRAVNGNQAAAEVQGAPPLRKQPIRATTLKKTKPSSAQSGGVPGVATSGVIVTPATLPMGAPLPNTGAAGCQVKGQPSGHMKQHAEGGGRVANFEEQTTLVKTAKNPSAAGVKRKRTDLVVNDGRQKRRL